MKQNKTLQILINIFLYLALVIAMFCMMVFLSQYRTAGFDFLGRVIIGFVAVLLVLVMLLILDFRNKIFEAKTIWSENLTTFFFFNLVLSFALWAYTFAHLGFPGKDNQNGL